MKSVLITGANRGIGFKLAASYASQDWTVYACCRKPEQAENLKQLAGEVNLCRLDVTDVTQITALAHKLQGVSLDILINNAGIYGPRTATLGNIDYEAWEQVLATNTLAPLCVSEAFLEHLKRGGLKTIATVTSKMGSLADNNSGGSYIYRSSKTAVNMVMKSLSVDLAPQGFTCVLLHPGWVQTDMGGPSAMISVEQSVSGIRVVLDNLTQKDNGCFFNYNGDPIPW